MAASKSFFQLVSYKSLWPVLPDGRDYPNFPCM